jgi:hypothetical protein
LKGAAFGAMENADGAVHIHAAQHDHALGCPAKNIHQALRLAKRTDDEIDHHVRSQGPQFPRTVAKPPAIAPDVLDTVGRGRCAAVKKRKRMSVLLQCPGNRASDESVSADQKNAHSL